MQLEIGCPRHGWLPVSLHIAGRSFDFIASNVMNDPVIEIVAAAIWCLDPDYPIPDYDDWLHPPIAEDGMRYVQFWLERTWHTMLVFGHGDATDTHVWFYANHPELYDSSRQDFRATKTSVCEFMTANAFASAVKSNISRLWQSHAHDYATHWRRRIFPLTLLQDLTEMVSRSEYE